MNTATAIKAYANAGLEGSITTADPHKLILMLYQGALLAIASAKNQMLRKEIAAKGASISHAISIIDGGLKSTLNKEAGGELAQNLDDLYTYMINRLLIANINNDVTILDEVSSLLIELRTAWETLRQNQNAAVADATPVAPSQPVPAKQPATLVYGRM